MRLKRERGIRVRAYHRSLGWHQRITESSDGRQQFPVGLGLVYNSIDQLAGFLWNLASGKHDYWSFRSEMPYFMGKLVPVHFGHLVIENNGVKAAHRRERQPSSRRCCGQNEVARLFEYASFVIHNLGAVVDAEKHFLGSLARLTHRNAQRDGQFCRIGGKLTEGVFKAELPLVLRPKGFRPLLPQNLAHQCDRLSSACLFKIAQGTIG